MGSLVKTITPEAKNVLINGNFDFWQRTGSTSVQPAAASVFNADRWKVVGANSVTGTAILQQATDVPTKAQAGFQSRYSQQISCNTSQSVLVNGNFYVFRQVVEGQNVGDFVGQKATLSFWVKCSYTGNFCTAIGFQGASTGQYVMDYTINSANTWEKKTLTIDFTSASSTNFNYDNGVGVYVDFPLVVGPDRVTSSKNQWLVTGTTVQGSSTQSNFFSSNSNIIYFAQISLTPAVLDANIPFQRAGRTLGNELQLCQRYYEKSYEIGVNPATNTVFGLASGLLVPGTTNRLVTNVQFKVPKRPGGTTQLTWSEDGTPANVSDYSNATTKVVTASVNGQGENNLGRFFQTAGTYSASIMYVFHWTAEAEL